MQSIAFLFSLTFNDLDSRKKTIMAKSSKSKGKKPSGKKEPCNKKKCKKSNGNKKGGKKGKKKETTALQMTPVALINQTTAKSLKSKKGKPRKKGKAKTKVSSKGPKTVTFTSRVRPSPVMGRIYFGSGFGGGGLIYGSEQVGDNYNNVIRTSTNPDFYPSAATGDYLTRTGYGSMTGAGIGTVFSTVFKTLLPVFKGLLKVGSTVAKSPAGQAIKNEIIKSGLKTGIGVVGDALRGANIKKSAKSHVVEQVKQFPTNVSRAVLKIDTNKSQKTISRQTPTTASGKRKFLR